MAKKTIVLLGCFDTKGEPYSWLRDRFASNGIGTLLVDISVAGEPMIEPDIRASEIATAAGADLERLRAAGDEDQACADYIAELLRGSYPDPRPYIERVYRSDVGKWFTDPLKPEYPREDLGLATA